MKKKIIIIFITILIILGGISLCFNKIANKKMKLQKIKIAEVTHSSFYTPLYVAIENDYFKDENLDVELILTPGADKVSAAVLSNDVEIGLAGAESVIYIYNQKEKDYPVLFAGLTKRDGQFIVSRSDEKFDLNNLLNKEILVGRKTGMPALNFLNALKNNNVDVDKININYNIDFASLSGAFIGGTGDYVNLFEPNATKMEKEGYGKIVASVGELSGEVPYTAFYARKSYLKNNKLVIDKFTKAINKAINYTYNNDELIVAQKIIKQFPNTNVNDLAKMIKNYKEYDCWLKNTYISEKLFTNLEDFLIDFKLIDSYVPYDKIVNNFYYE